METVLFLHNRGIDHVENRFLLLKDNSYVCLLYWRRAPTGEGTEAVCTIAWIARTPLDCQENLFKKRYVLVLATSENIYQNV